MSQIAYTRIDQLPETFPVFPLTSVVLFPGGILPLNVFEPRYLNMVDDCMAGDGMIGMIQPTGGERHHPDLADVGTLGRIAQYGETNDGRYLISLEGICRFAIAEELPFERPYREVRADWSGYSHDLTQADATGGVDRDEILFELKRYLKRNDLKADWDTMEDVPEATLINALCTSCPFSPVEKQALLEAGTLKSRAETLIALFHLSSTNNGDGSWQN
ncbi:MAG: peptidase S16 [Ponticaulis sp.]|nr:peptidase S16 [Ponticaulis sp.]